RVLVTHFAQRTRDRVQAFWLTSRAGRNWHPALGFGGYSKAFVRRGTHRENTPDGGGSLERSQVGLRPSLRFYVSTAGGLARPAQVVASIFEQPKPDGEVGSGHRLACEINAASAAIAERR